MQAVPTAFEAIYRREFPFVWAAARRFGVHPAAIDDAVQDVFVTAYRKWDDLHYEVSPRAWLYGVTRRVAFRYRRTEARTARRKSAVSAASRRSHEPHEVLDSEHDVDVFLAALPPGRREVFVMSELLDMSGPEIAAELGIPLNTVYSRLRLARKQLARTNRGTWLHRARRAQSPPRGQARRTWAVIVPSLGRLSLAPIGIGVGGKIAAATAAALGALVLVATVTQEEPAQQPSPSTSVENPGPSVVARAHDEPMPPASADPSPTPPTSDPVFETGPPPGPVRSSAPATPTNPTPRRSIDPEDAPLDAEVAVLDRAAEALRRGEAARSLQWLAEHESRFPQGRLVDIRKATRIRALCRLGRHARARAEAAALRREHPGSAVARAVSESCEDA